MVVPGCARSYLIQPQPWFPQRFKLPKRLPASAGAQRRYSEPPKTPCAPLHRCNYSPSNEAPPCYQWRVPPSGTRRCYGGRTRGSTCDGQPKIGSVTETTETGQGTDGGVVQRLVLQPGTLATGSLMARALGSCSGRGVGQTSGRTVGRASGLEFPIPKNTEPEAP